MARESLAHLAHCQFAAFPAQPARRAGWPDRHRSACQLPCPRHRGGTREGQLCALRCFHLPVAEMEAFLARSRLDTMTTEGPSAGYREAAMQMAAVFQE